MKKFSILFDLDGTLWDSTKTSALSMKNVLKNYNFTEDDIKGIMGMTTDEIADKLFPNLDKNERLNIINMCLEEENNIIRKIGGSLYKNVIDELNLLSKKYDLYIISNCQKGYIESFLDYYKLNNLFKDIECYGNTKLNKPENIKLIIDRNKIGKCVYVGDTMYDCKSARKNNIPFIYASYGFGNVDDYDYKINDFKELKDVISLLDE